VILVSQGINLEHHHILVPLQLLAGQLVQVLVNFDGDHPTGVLSQQGGQRAHSGADFQNDILGTDFGRLCQDLDQVQVDQKILAMPRVGLQADLRKTSSQIRNRLPIGFRHQTVPITFPGLRALCSNPASSSAIAPSGQLRRRDK